MIHPISKLYQNRRTDVGDTFIAAQGLFLASGRMYREAISPNHSHGRTDPLYTLIICVASYVEYCYKLPLKGHAHTPVPYQASTP